MKCSKCNAVDLGNETEIVAIEGILICTECSIKQYTESELINLSETVKPIDIGILPEHVWRGLKCTWCGIELHSVAIETEDGIVCGQCAQYLASIAY